MTFVSSFNTTAHFVKLYFYIIGILKFLLIDLSVPLSTNSSFVRNGNIPTMLAVLFLVLKPIGDATLVERALGAGLGEVGVRLGEETAGLGGVLVQAGLGTVAAKLVALGWGCGVLVGGFEGAVTVVPFGHVSAKPAVARAVLIPEGMVDGEDGVAPFGRVQQKPEDLYQ